MSKAYDRVNICMLQHAMNRIKLLPLFIRFISNLFTNRSDRIFTPFDLTDPYNILVGIDQGEVICPLLWCIYYDPLLSFIQNKTSLGYELKTYDWPTVNDIVSDSHSSCLSERIPDTAFIDDTTWIARSITDLQDILAIAQSFCSLNDIWINNDKATLLTNNKLHTGKELLEAEPSVTQKRRSRSTAQRKRRSKSTAQLQDVEEVPIDGWTSGLDMPIEGDSLSMEDLGMDLSIIDGYPEEQQTYGLSS